MQDFTKSKRIRLFKNGDIYTPAKKLVVSPRIYRNFEQFLNRVSSELKLSSGAVRRVYDIKGKPVHGLEDIIEGGSYVASSGEFFKRAAYLLREQPSPNSMDRKTSGRGLEVSNMFLSSNGQSDVSSHNKEGLMFHNHAKAFRVTVYANGEFAKPGLRMLLNYRTCKTFEQLLRSVSSLLCLRSGGVRRLYDTSNGRQIKKLTDLYDGQQIAGASLEVFKQVNYKPKSAMDKSHFNRNIDENRRIATFYHNGDANHDGYIVALRNTRYPNLKKLLDFINVKYSAAIGGLVKQVFTTDGELIADLEQIEHGQGYVLVCGNDHFIKIAYHVNSLPHAQGSRGMTGYTQNHELVVKARTTRALADNGGAAHQVVEHSSSFGNHGVQSQNHQATKASSDASRPPRDAAHQATEFSVSKSKVGTSKSNVPATKASQVNVPQATVNTISGSKVVAPNKTNPLATRAIKEATQARDDAYQATVHTISVSKTALNKPIPLTTKAILEASVAKDGARAVATSKPAAVAASSKPTPQNRATAIVETKGKSGANQAAETTAALKSKAAPLKPRTAPIKEPAALDEEDIKEDHIARDVTNDESAIFESATLAVFNPVQVNESESDLEAPGNDAYAAGSVIQREDSAEGFEQEESEQGGDLEDGQESEQDDQESAGGEEEEQDKINSSMPMLPSKSKTSLYASSQRQSKQSLDNLA